MDTPVRQAAVAERFQSLFGAAPVVWSRAPGRVDLMGSHTDYNLGYVMTMTIDRDTWIAARPRTDRTVRVQSLNQDGVSTFSLDDIGHDPAVHWSDYVRGVAWTLHEEGCPLVGFDGLIHSTVPFGSGLSSSAALEMATGVTFQQLAGFALDPVRMALLCQRAENRFVGVSCGILDQYSSAMGREGSGILLDCRALTSRSVSLGAGLQVVICDTRAPRNLAGTEYDERRGQCADGVRIIRGRFSQVEALRDVTPEMLDTCSDLLSPVVARRCRFIVEENQRVLDLAEALPAPDVDALGSLCSESYAGARDLYEIGAPAMASMVRAMTEAPGVVGARQAGAGFGGCMVALVHEAEAGAFANAVVARYRIETGITPVVYPVRPAAAAGPL